MTGIREAGIKPFMPRKPLDALEHFTLRTPGQAVFRACPDASRRGRSGAEPGDGMLIPHMSDLPPTSKSDVDISILAQWKFSTSVSTLAASSNWA